MLEKGTFIKIREDSDFRAGHDGMVMSPEDENGDIGLVFYCDRYNETNPSPCVGIELWNISEIDLKSVEK